MSSRRDLIESIDGGVVQYNEADDYEADAMNADTFGDDALEDFDPSGMLMGKREEESPLMAPLVPPGLGFGEPLIDNRGPMRSPKNPLDSLIKNLSISGSQSFPSQPTPPPPPPAQLLAPQMLNVSTRFVAPPPPPPPPPTLPPSVTAFDDDGMPRMSIHAYPVRVFPTPFTAAQRAQAIKGGLDPFKWGPQGGDPHRNRGIMTHRDKEYVTKIQLNQMVALSGQSAQNYKGQFTFGRSSSSLHKPSLDSQPTEEDSLGKRLYSSVYHPRKLVDVSLTSNAPISSNKSVASLVERAFDLSLDVYDIDEYISTLHPLAEQKIAEAVTDRTHVLNDLVSVLQQIAVMGYGNNKKAVEIKKRAIDFIVEFLQPQQSASDAEARRSLIFRRVPESVQAVYIDMLERLVGNE
jgi:hypothetical protein